MAALLGHCIALRPSRRYSPTARPRVTVTSASLGGFRSGADRKTAARKGSVKGIQERAARKDFDEYPGWAKCLDAPPEDGKTQAIIVEDQGYLLATTEGRSYAIAANCGACKFPMINGELGAGAVAQAGANLEFGVRSAAAITCPCCSSQFYLLNGEVAKWCDGTGKNMLGNVLGKILSSSPPARIKAYATRTSQAGRVYVRLENKAAAKTP